MAHFAKIGLNYKVLEIIVIDDNIINDKSGNVSEKLGIDFAEELTGYPYWIQTSYDEAFRGNYAGIDFKYDSSLDAFIPPKPYSSWVLDEDTYQWDSPIPYPGDGSNAEDKGINDTHYVWDEEIKDWVLLTEE